jgi:WD40 repeat protein
VNAPRLLSVALCLVASFVAIAQLPLASVQAADDLKPIAIAEIKRDMPVHFEKEILPILSKNCLACHNGTKAENKLVLETPQSILKGGDDGPAVIAKKSGESLLLKSAAHLAEPTMPPDDNNVGAKPLTSDELGLLKLWIDQGATGEVTGSGGPVKWQSLPPGINPIYAVSVSPDGQFAACGRANQIFVYHLPSGRLVTRLTDPELVKTGFYKTLGVAHLDMVQSLAFSPDGELLASGAYREVKLWRRPHDVERGQLVGLAEPAQCLAVSADASLAATGDAKGTITIWDLASGKPRKAFVGHGGPVTALRFAPGAAPAAEERLVSASMDKSIRFWNPADGTLMGRIDTASPVSALAVLAGGQQVASGGGDSLVRVWTMPTSPTRGLADVPGPITAVAASPDKKSIAVAGADGAIALVDAVAGKVITTLAGRKVAVTALSFSGDGARLASSEADGVTRVWDVAQAMPLAVLSGAPATAVALHSAGNSLATGTADGKLVVWKLDVPAPAAAGADLESPATLMATSGDGKRLALATTVAGKPAVVVLDVAGGNVVATLVGHEAPITALAINADGSKLASGSGDKTARLWNVADGKELAKFTGHGGPVTAVAIGSGGAPVASGAADNSLKLWNAADGMEIKNFAGHTAAIVAIALPASGQSLVSTGAEKGVRIWNLADGAQARSIDTPAAATALALSRDDVRLAVGLADGTTKVFQLADGKELSTLAAGPTTSLSFSVDGARLLACGAKQAGLWDLATATLVELLPADAGCAALTASGEAVAVTAEKKVVRRTPQAERALVGPSKKITRLAFKPAAGVLFAASEDGTTRAYDTASGQQTFSANNTAPVRDLAISPDGKLLAAACEDKQVRVWSADNGSPAPKPALAGFSAAVTSVAFSADSSKIVAAGAAAGEVLVFGVVSGTVEQSFSEHPAPVVALVASGDKETLVLSAAGDKDIKIWPLVVGVSLAGHTKPITALAASPVDKNILFSAADENAVRQWNLQNGQVTRQFDHGAPVTALALRGDGLQLASAGGLLVRLWKADNGQPWTAANNQPLPEMKGDLRAQLNSTALERQVAIVTAKVADNKKTVTESEAKITSTAEAIKTTTAAIETAAKALAEKTEAAKAPVAAKEAADKELVEATAAVKAALEKSAAAKDAADKDAQNAELKKAAEEAKKAAEEADKKQKDADKKAKDAAPPAAKATQEAGAADAAKMAADQALLSAMNSSKKAIESLPLAQAAVTTSETQLAETQARFDAAKQQVTAAEKPFRALAYSADGSQLAAAGDNQIVRLFSAENGAPLDSFAKHQAAVNAVAFTPTGDLVSVAADKLGIVWNTNPAWTLERTIGNVDDPAIFVDRVLALAFSPDGKQLATGGGEPSRSGELKLWTVADGKLTRAIAPAHSDTVFGLEFSPEGVYLASAAADRFVKVFDANSGALVRAFEGHTHHVLDVAWRSDGKLLASGGADNVIKVWDFVTGDQKLTTQPLPKEVTSLMFVALSNKLIASCGDRSVRLFSADNQNPERNFVGPTDFIYAAAVTADGRIVIAGGQESTLFEWNLENGQSIRTFEATKPAEEPKAEGAKKVAGGG